MCLFTAITSSYTFESNLDELVVLLIPPKRGEWYEMANIKFDPPGIGSNSHSSGVEPRDYSGIDMD